MRFIDSLCPPALLYLLYIVIHVGLSLASGMFVTAAVNVVMGIAGVIMLDVLCGIELGVVSWVIIATPFIMVALAVSISMGLGIDRLAKSYLREHFQGPLTGDNLKNRDTLVTPLKEGDALPLSTSSTY